MMLSYTLAVGIIYNTDKEVGVPYSGKVLREKTFVNFVVFGYSRKLSL